MTSDRFGSISDILTSRPARPQATVHPITPVEPEPETATSPAQPTRRRVPATPKSQESTGGARRVAFRLDPELHTRLVAHVKQTDSTLGNVVLDAIEGAHLSGDLERLVAAARRRPAAPPAAGLFVRTVPRGSAEASVPVEIQLHAQAVTQIDKLVKQHQADNRTQLITVALQAHL